MEKNPRIILKDLVYAGYLGSLGKNVALYSSLYPLYDFYSELLEKSVKPYKYLAPVATSLTVSLIIQPFDYYKTVKMARGQNMKGYSGGLSLMIARSVPHFWITMWIIELFNK